MQKICYLYIMKNNHEKYWFYEFKRQDSFAIPLMILPSIWLEDKHQGLLTKSYRITAGFLRYRFYLYFGYKMPEPNSPITSAEYGLEKFSKWISKWARKKISQKEVEAWAQTSEFKTLIRHGGTNIHYGKIILGRDYMSQSNTAPAPKSKAAKHYIKENAEIELDIDIDD